MSDARLGQAAISDDNLLGWIDILSSVRLRWKLVVSIGLLGALVAAVPAFLMTPVYRAEVVIAPVSPDNTAGSIARLMGQLGPLAGFAGDLGGGGIGRREVWLATLRSRELAQGFVASQKILQVLFADRWDASTNRWKAGGAHKPVPTIDDALVLLNREILEINEDKRTGLVTVAVEWRDRQLAARWANDLVAKANAVIRQRAIDESARNIEFLEMQLAKTHILERQQIIYRLIESRTSEIMMANGRPQYAFTVVDNATAPDPDKFVRPQRLLMIVGSCFAALLAGSAIAIFLFWRKGARLSRVE